jgi:hypothetical protein
LISNAGYDQNAEFSDISFKNCKCANTLLTAPNIHITFKKFSLKYVYIIYNKYIEMANFEIVYMDGKLDTSVTMGKIKSWMYAINSSIVIW